MAKKNDSLNAKNVDFTQPGAGLLLGGVTERNLYAKYDKLRGVRDEKAGGSKQLWDNLSRWTTTKQGAKLDPTQAKLFNQYIKTGKKPDGLSDATTMAAMDWGLREAGRFQQHKPVSLLSQIASPLLTIAAGAINPALGAAVGGYMGSRNGGSLLNIGLSALGGYMGGNAIANAGGVSGIASNIKNGVGNLLGGGGFSNPSALGLSGSNLGLNFASAPGGFAAAPVAGYGASGLGLTGANLGVGLTNSLGGATVGGYGGGALGGDPTDLYQPQALAGPSKPGMSTAEKVIRGAKTGLKIGSLLDAPQSAGQGLMTPGSVGAAKPMVPQILNMRPFIPYRYFGANTNPFMARIT